MNYTNPKYRDTFIQAYIACALWASLDGTTPEGGEPMDKNYQSSDLSALTLTKVEGDCNSFINVNVNDLADYPAGAAGHDFWLTRNGHGTGFWENDYGTEEQCKALTESSHVCGECHLYVGDDGLLYLS